MGYTLTIGEFEVDINKDDRYASCGAKIHSAEGAPLNSSDLYTSECWPSYGAWKSFAEGEGLLDVFFANTLSHPVSWVDGDGQHHDGLILQHPGAAALTEAHLKRFKAARENYTPKPENFADGVDYVLRRLDWLVFWTEWALKNCEYPTFANS